MTNSIFSHAALYAVSRRLTSGTAIAAILFGTIAPAFAETSLDNVLQDIAPMSADELNVSVGGFSLGDLNLAIGFAISTSLSGGALGNGFTVTTTFTIPSLNNLGAQISGDVNKSLDAAGIADLGGAISKKVDDALTLALTGGPGNSSQSGSSAADNSSSGGADTNAGNKPDSFTFTSPSSGGNAPTMVTTITPNSNSSGSGAAPQNAGGLSFSISGSGNGPSKVVFNNTPSSNSAGGAPTGATAENSKPAEIPQYTAVFDPIKNSVQISAGNTNVVQGLMSGPTTLIQSSENGVHIENFTSANLQLGNYVQLADQAALRQRIESFGQKILQTGH